MYFDDIYKGLQKLAKNCSLQLIIKLLPVKSFESTSIFIFGFVSDYQYIPHNNKLYHKFLMMLMIEDIFFVAYWT